MYIERVATDEACEVVRGSNMAVVDDVELSLEKSSWLAFAERVAFADQRLSSIPTLFKTFYEEQLQNPDTTLLNLIDGVLIKAYSQYSEEDAYDICRFYLFATVLTQFNERKDKRGNLKTHRKSEIDSLGRPYPTIIHPTRVMHNGFDLQTTNVKGDSQGIKGVKPYILKVLVGHDIAEDCEITIQDEKSATNQKLEGEELLHIIETEFIDGSRIRHSVNSLTKYEELTPEMENTVHDSLLMKYMLWYIPETQDGGDDVVTVGERSISKKQYDDIMKSITSLVRLRLDAYGRYIETGDTEAYMDEIAVNLYTKICDIVDNTQTGVSFFSEVRARMIATIARVFMLDESNDIMHNLALQSKDALFENLQNKELAQLLEQPNYRISMDQGIESLIRQQFGIDVKATTGYRISFIDEVVSAEDAPHAVAQILIEVDPEHYRDLVENLSLLVGIEDFRNLLHTSQGLVIEKYNGVLQNIIEALGRSNTMFEVKEMHDGEIAKNVIQYIRIVSKEPDIWGRMLQNRYEKKSPEEKFFAPPAHPATALQNYLDMQLLLFNAEALKGQNGIYVLVSDSILTTCHCSSEEEFRNFREKAGINDGEYRMVELMNPKCEILDDHRPEYPFYHATRSSNVSSQADPLQLI